MRKLIEDKKQELTEVTKSWTDWSLYPPEEDKSQAAVKKAARDINSAIAKFKRAAKNLPKKVPVWNLKKVGDAFDEIAEKYIYKVMDKHAAVGTQDITTRDKIYTDLISFVNGLYGKKWSKLGQFIYFY